MNLLEQNITYLAGVGPRIADLLKRELNIHTVDDLLRHYPYKHIDRSRFYRINEINDEQTYVQIKGQIVRMEVQGEGRKTRLSAVFTDGYDTVELVWFKGLRYVQDRLRTSEIYVLFGKPNRFNNKWNFAHPELETLHNYNQQGAIGLEPHYNTSEKMKSSNLTSKHIRKIIHNLLPVLKQGLPETLPLALLQTYKLPSLAEALSQIHFPTDTNQLKRARQRLKFEELFYIQLNILQKAKQRERAYKGFSFSVVGNYFNTFYKDYLPFSLTNAQKRVIKEIRADMGSGRQMNRLLQGDVGSGKTLVALMCTLLAADNNYQACIMAPTEILATQHFHSVTQMLGDIGINTALLTGSTRKAERERIHKGLITGQIHLLIGTHALLEDAVQFYNLGLVVIDEQHRFGVAQRAKMWSKNTQPPHILVMTATPIPRTLAMTVYGDLRVSVIDELPPGRKPIQTMHYYNTNRQKLNVFIRQQVDEGRQIYVVYPLIQESEKMDLANLEAGYVNMCEAFPTYKISMVHGKMKPAEKDAQMERFSNGETQIMVATTVIEVGVNVPNASVMIIENAERFGLSQLHQLRGRVGRGAAQSYCILLTDVKLANDTRKRMNIMTQSNDGFVIAEADMQLRGPGDMEGTAQSGMPFELRIANLATDGQMLEIARRCVNDILEQDPSLTLPQYSMLLPQLRKLHQRQINWSVIS